LANLLISSLNRLAPGGIIRIDGHSQKAVENIQMETAADTDSLSVWD